MGIDLYKMMHHLCYVHILIFFTLSCLGQQLDVHSICQLEHRHYVKGNSKNKRTHIFVGHENSFCCWDCPQGELYDAVAAAIRYVRYQRKCANEIELNVQPLLVKTNQCVQLPSPINQFEAPIAKNFVALGVSVHDMDAHTLSFQVKNSVSSFALRCILVAFFYKKTFLFAVYVNVNTGKITPDFREIGYGLSLASESRYPYLTVDECEKQDDACANLFKPITYEVTGEQLSRIIKCTDKTSLSKPLFNLLNTNDIEVLIGDL